jgi:hypothetical protein
LAGGRRVYEEQQEELMYGSYRMKHIFNSRNILVIFFLLNVDANNNMYKSEGKRENRRSRFD